MRGSGVLSRARRRVLAVGVVVTVGWVVAGCTGGVEPDPSPSVGVSAESSPTETPEASPTEAGPVRPERPAAMDRDDAEGAAAAAEYFLELYPYVMATGDTAEWEAMSHQECGYCGDAMESATWLSGNSATFSGGATSIQVLHNYGRDSETGIYPLDVLSTQDRIVVTAQDGTLVDEVQRSESEFRVEVGLSDGAWVVVEAAPITSAGS